MHGAAPLDAPRRDREENVRPGAPGNGRERGTGRFPLRHGTTPGPHQDAIQQHQRQLQWLRYAELARCEPALFFVMANCHITGPARLPERSATATAIVWTPAPRSPGA